MDVSVYSLIAVSRAAVPLMTEGGSIMTMSLLRRRKGRPQLQRDGHRQVRPRVHRPLSRLEPRPQKHPRQRHLRRPHQDAGRPRRRRPDEMMRAHAERAPLHRNVDQLEVGGAALFLASDLSSAITGEVLYVDCGYNVMGFSMTSSALSQQWRYGKTGGIAVPFPCGVRAFDETLGQRALEESVQGPSFVDSLPHFV
jgi:enoyl-[acyl-carrier protein] reductase I